MKKNRIPRTTQQYFQFNFITCNDISFSNSKAKVVLLCVLGLLILRSTSAFAQKQEVVHQASKLSQVNSNFKYNRSHFKIWTCKQIDDNWKPINIVNKIKAGECVQLFFESSDKIKNQGSMRWGIFKLNPDGSEEFVNQKDQGCGDNLPEFRRMSYEECNEFRTPGVYRIYISTKDDSDAFFAVNNQNYFAKVDLIVE